MVGDCVNFSTWLAGNRSSCKADLVNFKYVIDKRPGSQLKELKTVGTIINKSPVELKVQACIRLYDADGFELDVARTSDGVTLSPGQSGAVTSNWSLDSKEWARVVSLKAYAFVAALGACQDAISSVVEIKTNNSSQ
jgi:hypothetical protein